MKSIIFSLLLFITLSVTVDSRAYAFNDIIDEPFDVTRQDMQLHTATSYGIALTGTMILRTQSISPGNSLLYSSMATFALGFLKEAYMDKAFSKGDMIANGIGIGANLLVSTTFSF